jgi:hypothetical protein
MVNLGEILTLDNNKKFVVISTTNYENNLYCYVAELDNFDNTKIYLVKGEHLVQVIDEKLIEELENIFANTFVD